MEDTFQTIQSIGSKKLLERITNADATFKHPDVIQSVGDDAAVLKSSGDALTLLTTDTFVEGVDFDLTYTPFHHLGYKIISAAVSDIYAMNGKPDVALINLALPNRISVQMMEQLYQGLYAAGHLHGIEIAGGDMKANHANLVISVNISGTADKNKITYRKG